MQLAEIGAWVALTSGALYGLTFWARARLEIGRLKFRYKIVRRNAGVVALVALSFLVVRDASFSPRSSPPERSTVGSPDSASGAAPTSAFSAPPKGSLSTPSPLDIQRREAIGAVCSAYDQNPKPISIEDQIPIASGILRKSRNVPEGQAQDLATRTVHELEEGRFVLDCPEFRASPADPKAALDAMCSAANHWGGGGLLSVVSGAETEYSRSHHDPDHALSVLDEALRGLPEKQTILQACKRRGVSIAKPGLGALRSIGAARETIAHMEKRENLPDDGVDESPPTDLERREAILAWCAAHAEKPDAELTDLIFEANVIFSDDPNVSPDRTGPVMGKTFAELLFGGPSAFAACH